MTRLLVVGSVALALLGSTASAAQKSAPPKEADLGTKRSVAPDASLGGTLEAKKPKKVEKGPALDFETFRKQVEVTISQKRREEIASLRRLIDLGGGPQADTPQWYFRLAELLWEESQYFFFEANRRDDRILSLGNKGDPREIQRLHAEKKDLERESERNKEQAVALYKAIVAKYPKYPRLDEVLYFLAESLSKRNRNDPDALKAYRALIQRFPKSRFVPDAWMAFGEYYFERANASERVANLRRALEAYQKAASYQESSVYGYALYKQGWVHYNLTEWAEALELFKAVIFFGELPTSTVPADRKIALVKEARKDYVRTYSHVGSAEGAPEEFKRVGGAGWADMLKTLGTIFYDEGKDRDAIVIHHRLIQEKPLAPEAPFYQSRIVTSAGRMGKKEAAVQQAHVFVKMLREIEASPEAKDEKGRKTLEDARREAEQTLRILAVTYHSEWKKTRDEPVAGYAAAVYRDYLEIFPNEPTAYEMRFFHAELRYALADFEGAGDEYERVVAVDLEALQAKPPRKAGKFFKDSLENTVFAWDLVAKKLDEGDKAQRAPADPKKRIPLAPARQKLADACARYLKWQPKGEKWVEIAYKLANIHYRHNAFGEATDLFTRIALDHPSHELAGYSTNLVLDAYNLLGDWRNVNGWAKRFYANHELVKAHPALKDDLAKVIEQSAFKVIEEKERARDHEGAAEEYLAFVRDWPQSRLAPTALFNASVDYVKAHRLDRAVEVRQEILRKFPQDPFAPKVLYDNAEAYEAMAEFAKAADLYERYFAEWRKSHDPRARAKAKAIAKAKATKGKDGEKDADDGGGGNGYEEKKANDAVVNAAVFRAGLREWARAEAASRAYLETWPNGADAQRIFLSIADLHAKQGQHAKELKQLEEYQKRYAYKDPEEWLAIQHRIAQLLEKQRSPLAHRAYAEGLQYWRRKKADVKERGLAVVAQGLYEDLEPSFVEYDRITLNVGPKYLKSQLQVKGNKLKKLEEAYGQVVKMKQAEPAICALYKIGLAYERFAQALFAVPIPRELRGDPTLVQEYKSQLTTFADPLRQKAVEGLALAAKASRDYGVVNDCARAAGTLLAKAKPEEYGPAPEPVPPLAPAPAVAASPRGYGLLTELIPPARERGPRRAEATALPPLRTRAAAGNAPATPEPVVRTGDPADPQQRLIRDEPPPPMKRKTAKKGQADDDEDLLE